MTCGYCGSRTNFEDYSYSSDQCQIHKCLNATCGYVFLAAED
jgi:hypothetical protein